MDASDLWLDDPQINACMSRICEEGRDRMVYASNSHLLQMAQGRLLAGGGERLESIFGGKKRNLRLEELRKWIIPINQDNVHWKLAVVMIREHLIVFYDSLAEGPPSVHAESADMIRMLLRTYGRIRSLPEFSEWPWISTCAGSFAQPQTDTYSCGIYCIVAAELNASHPEHLVRGIDIPDAWRCRRMLEVGKADRMIEGVWFSRAIVPPAKACLVFDPHFAAESPREASKRLKRRLRGVREVKKTGGGGCFYPRYASAWAVPETMIMATFRLADDCAKVIRLSGGRIWIRAIGYDCHPFLFERLLLSNIITPQDDVYLHVMCDRDDSKLGTAPIEDMDPTYPIFDYDDYESMALLSESIHALRQAIGRSLAQVTIGTRPPKGGCDLYLTRTCDDLDDQIRRGPLRERKGTSVQLLDSDCARLISMAD